MINDSNSSPQQSTDNDNKDHKRRNRSDSFEHPSDAASAKRSRSTSASRKFSASALDIISAIEKSIEKSEARVLCKIEAMLDLKISEVRSEFDAKLSALSSSVDDRIKVASLNGINTDVTNRLDLAVTTINDIALITDVRIESLERYRCLNDVVINGIPFIDKEDVFSLFKCICDAIGFNHGSQSISSIFRLPIKRNVPVPVPTPSSSSAATHTINIPSISSPPIIVKFYNTDLSRQFFMCYLKHGRLNLTHIGFNTPARIYINENLTKSNREIFRHCIKLKHEHKKYLLNVYTKYGSVYVHIAGLEKHLSIQSKKDIDSIVKHLTSMQPSAT